MLYDFNEAWPRVAEARYDFCVCGTGPAGLTIARKLATHGKKVLLLEAGGLSYSDDSQDHYKGKSVGRTFWWVESGRARYFGGTSNYWAGICAIFDSTAFEERNYPRLPAWPISYEQVLRHLDEAKEILDIPGAEFSVAKYPGFESPSFNRFTHFYSAPTRFGEKYGLEIRQSQHIDAFYNANLVDLELSDDLAGVKHLKVRNYKGEIVEVAAAQYVLALGSIENARSLLVANSQVPSGVGNHSGMVGRCFMESLNAPIGRFVITNPEFWQRFDGFGFKGFNFVPTQEFMKKNDINDGVISFHLNAQPESSGRLRVFKQFLRETGCVSPKITELARRIADFDCPGDGIISSLIAQEANPSSRVSLADDVDAFGLRRVKLDWEFSERDFKTIRILSIELAKELARFNLARVQLAPFILDANRDDVEMGVNGHQMGTTRMSADPRYGVVNENCRVHGIRNLYIAGSSVFPYCGGRNPTLTIVMLALRLAEFLSSQA